MKNPLLSVNLSLSFFILSFFFVPLLSSCTLLADLAPVKEDNTEVRDWLVLPVFYATTRKRAKSENIEFLEERAEKGLKFGVKNVVVPAPLMREASDKTRNRLGWKLIHLDSALPDGKKPACPPADSCALPDRELSPEEVVAEFEKYRQKSGKTQAVFFVHGCCATFDGSLDRAGKILAHMQMPLVMFDWDSPKGFTKYLQNETLAEQTYDDFFDFLNSLENLLAPSDTILLGHSMGARFLDNALLRRSERARFKLPFKKYSEVIYSQPDSDARSYIRHNQAVAGQAEKTRIYYNTRDGRLDASATAHGGYERLGRPGALLEKLCQVDDQDMIDITSCASGHEIPFWVVADFSNGDSVEHAGYLCKENSSHSFVLRKNSKSKSE